jgi:hypothetical protein
MVAAVGKPKWSVEVKHYVETACTNEITRLVWYRKELWQRKFYKTEMYARREHEVRCIIEVANDAHGALGLVCPRCSSPLWKCKCTPHGITELPFCLQHQSIVLAVSRETAPAFPVLVVINRSHPILDTNDHVITIRPRE